MPSFNLKLALSRRRRASRPSADRRLTPFRRYGFGSGDEPASEVTAASKTITVTASQLAVGTNVQRRGVDITVDAAATGHVYLLLWDGNGAQPTASATNFHYSMGASGNWNGEIGAGPMWNGAVVVFADASTKIGVVEV